jgi:hypothetical protein
VAFAVAVPVTPAAAQNVFETLFGGLRRPSPPRVQISTPSDLFRSVFQSQPQPNRESVQGAGGGIGPRTAYCVRLCDGRFFPLQPQRNASAATQCSAFCPATETRIFSGRGIEHAVAANGRRYADLPNAYLYRKRIVPGCSCSGAGTTGVAPVPVDEDLTLRPGDIVAGNAGFTVYRGKDQQQHPQFTPIELANVSQRVREQLANVKIAPPLPSAAAAAAALPAKSASGPTDREQASAAPDAVLLSARGP